jgi:ABC-type sugar transport system permease subunit
VRRDRPFVGFAARPAFLPAAQILIPEAKRMKKRRRKNSDTVFAYLMLAPDMIGLAIFVFLPILISFYVSLNSWNTLEPMKFTGAANYLALLSDNMWWSSLWKTVAYSCSFVPIVFICSLSLAVFIHSLAGRPQQFFRTLYFIPYAISTIVAAIIWRFMMDERKGFLNMLLKTFGLPAQRFLGDPQIALFCIAVISAWLVIGYYTIVFLAAIKDINPSYYEAAKLDGANFVQSFRHITAPMLREVSAFVLIVTTIASFQVFDQIKILTKGGPAQATNVSVFYIYTNAFEYMKLGYASALAFVLFLVILTLSLLQLRLTGGDRRA